MEGDQRERTNICCKLDIVFTSLQIDVKMVTNNLSVVKILKGVFNQLDS